MKTKKWYSIFMLLFSTLFILTGCSDELEDLNGDTLIKKYEIPGKYLIQITPKMLGVAPITSGLHEAELMNEGNGILRLKFNGFQKDPMPFEMSVDVRMLVKPGSNQELKIENIGGDFDADVPEGKVLNPNDIPEGIEVPEGALANGLHSKGESSIVGKYKMMVDPGLNTESMNFDWELTPNVGLPVIVAIRTIKKIQ